MLEVKLWLYNMKPSMFFTQSVHIYFERDEYLFVHAVFSQFTYYIVHNVKRNTAYVIITQHLEYINKKYIWGWFLFSKMLYKYLNENKFAG